MTKEKQATQVSQAPQVLKGLTALKVKKVRLEQLVNLDYLELLEKMDPQAIPVRKETAANKVYLVNRARKVVLAQLAGQVCIT